MEFSTSSKVSMTSLTHFFSFFDTVSTRVTPASIGGFCLLGLKIAIKDRTDLKLTKQKCDLNMIKYAA